MHGLEGQGQKSQNFCKHWVKKVKAFLVYFFLAFSEYLICQCAYYSCVCVCVCTHMFIYIWLGFFFFKVAAQ